MRDGAGERMAHADLPRRSTPGHTQVAATVDGAAPVTRERRRDQVGRPPLRRTAQVQREARRPADHPGTIVDLHRPPALGRVGMGRVPGRRGDQTQRQRCGGDVRARLGVAGTTHGTQHGRVDQAATQARRAQRGAHRRAHQRRGGHARSRIRVQPREVAAGVEARQPPIDLGKHRRHVETTVGVAHDPGHGAHRREAVVEHTSSVSRGPGPREPDAAPYPRRRPAGGPRSARGSIGWSAEAAEEVAARAALSAGGGAARPLQRPSRPRRVSSVGASPWRQLCHAHAVPDRGKTTYGPGQLTRL